MGLVSFAWWSLWLLSNPGNLLDNSGFEVGGVPPTSWERFGSGTVSHVSGGSHQGQSHVTLGGPGLALLYQRAPGEPGSHYQVNAFVRGQGLGALKLEFHNAGLGKILERVVELNPVGCWNQYSVDEEAPSGTSWVTAAIVGNPGGTLDFDEVRLRSVEAAGRWRFDLDGRGQTFLGFGTQIWGYGAAPQTLATVLSELRIRFVRIEHHDEASTWSQLQATRAITDALDIPWISMVWSAPAAYRSGGILTDPSGFAQWWANHVDQAYAQGIPLEFVELMNEPDSQGQWSTGISPSDMSDLIQATRLELDALGHPSVGILAPGLSAMSWSVPDEYLHALEPSAISGLAGFSTHTWSDDFVNCADVSGTCLETNWQHFAKPASEVAPELPLFVTEHGSSVNEFQGVTYPDPNSSAPYSATASMGYAVRCFENTLAALNAGASSILFWQAMDEPTEVQQKNKSWGFVDLQGNPKPVYLAMRSLAAALPVGAEVVSPLSDQTLEGLYAAAFVLEDQVVVALANPLSVARDGILMLDGGESRDLWIRDSQACVLDQPGDVLSEVPDVARIVAGEASLTRTRRGQNRLLVHLPPVSTLVVVLESKAGQPRRTPVPDLR